MIYNNDCTLPKEYLEQLKAEGLEGLPEIIRLLVNQAIQIEQDKHLNAKPYECSEECNGHEPDAIIRPRLPPHPQAGAHHR